MCSKRLRTCCFNFSVHRYVFFTVLFFYYFTLLDVVDFCFQVFSCLSQSMNSSVRRLIAFENTFLIDFQRKIHLLLLLETHCCGYFLIDVRDGCSKSFALNPPSRDRNLFEKFDRSKYDAEIDFETL